MNLSIQEKRQAFVLKRNAKESGLTETIHKNKD
jgi:hypothetical protein